MKRTAVVFGLLALALGTSEASASSKSFNFYCAVNYALRACASVQVFTTPGGSGGTDVVIRVRNLQGALPDQTGGSIITTVGLTVPTAAIMGAASGLNVNTVGTVGVVGSPGTKWGFSSAGINGHVELVASTPSRGNNPDGGIQGCQTAGVAAAHYFDTCAGTGNTGWVSFNFHTANLWDASLAEVGLKYDGVVGLSTKVECRTESAPTDPTYCIAASVTPEPVSMALLATGLLGVGGAGLRRRRKRMDDTKNDA